jgi:ankyrin repeat protein
MTPLHLAVAAGYTDVAKMILKKSNVSINLKEKRMGRTALHLSCANNHLPIAKALLESGADVNLTTKFRK